MPIPALLAAVLLTTGCGEDPPPAWSGYAEGDPVYVAAPVAGQLAVRPRAGRTRDDTFYRVGEYVNAGQPVVSLLPPAQRKARFYVPEPELASLSQGQAVQLSCDGCGAPIAAHISYISPQPEYTPPVIYSNSQRSRLVFLVEARPDPAQALRLHPGQPLEVRPVANAAGAAASTASRP